MSSYDLSRLRSWDVSYLAALGRIVLRSNTTYLIEVTPPGESPRPGKIVHREPVSGGERGMTLGVLADIAGMTHRRIFGEDVAGFRIEYILVDHDNETVKIIF